MSNEALFLIWLAGWALLICAGIFYDSYVLGKGHQLSSSSAGELFRWGWTWPFMVPAFLLVLAVLSPFIGAGWAGEALGKRHKKS